MNLKQKQERALKWINGINMHHEIIDGKPIVDDQWQEPWMQVLVDAPDEIFATPGFYEKVELYAWKEIVKRDLGNDSQAALKHLNHMLATFAA
ncbi:MAG: hypothetical protein AB1607_08770 [Chloroflexota bacterium]